MPIRKCVLSLPNRLAHEPQAQASSAWLDRFATQAATLGIDAQTVYATLGKTPSLLPWSDAALQWRTP
jgi:hypothetical protein